MMPHREKVWWGKVWQWGARPASPPPPYKGGWGGVALAGRGSWVWHGVGYV